MIDPKRENPSERVFSFDPVDRAKQGRPRYVAAGLTVLRAYQVAGRPQQNGKVMGSYGEWCRTVRDALLWLGEADPVATCHPVNPDDPVRERFAAVVSAWRTVIGLGNAVTAKQAATMAIDAAADSEAAAARPELLDALKDIAPATMRGLATGIDVLRLGNWLRKQKGLVVKGLRFYPDDKGDDGRRWRLEDVCRMGGSDELS